MAIIFKFTILNKKANFNVKETIMFLTSKQFSYHQKDENQRFKFLNDPAGGLMCRLCSPIDRTLTHEKLATDGFCIVFRTQSATGRLHALRY